MIVESDRTPETTADAAKTVADSIGTLLGEALRKAINFVKGAWGIEVFSTEDTSSENEMSVVQYAYIGNSILLTADAGRAALTEAANYAVAAAIPLPVDVMQIPHHGSRRNVSTEVLDRWMGQRLASQPSPGTERSHAVVSSAKEDEHHPRKAVIRAYIHRGARVAMTEGQNVRFQHNAPGRAGWSATTPVPYPEEYES
jgi:beta-lactamase superfamily II metal-dependent hydrolase